MRVGAGKAERTNGRTKTKTNKKNINKNNSENARCQLKWSCEAACQPKWMKTNGRQKDRKREIEKQHSHSEFPWFLHNWFAVCAFNLHFNLKSLAQRARQFHYLYVWYTHTLTKFLYISCIWILDLKQSHSCGCFFLHFFVVFGVDLHCYTRISFNCFFLYPKPMILSTVSIEEELKSS